MINYAAGSDGLTPEEHEAHLQKKGKNAGRKTIDPAELAALDQWLAGKRDEIIGKKRNFSDKDK